MVVDATRDGEVARVLVGLDEYRVLGAVERDDELVVVVEADRPDMPCPRCGVFSRRVKQYRWQRV